MFTVITGAQFGDEGKGKIVDLLAEEYDIVARFQGGDNAGHTVVIGEETYKLHQIPSGILVGTTALIGPGVVLNPFTLTDELNMLKDRGISVTPETFGIDAKASIIMPYHIAMDALGEVSRKDKIGTTKKGIAYAYADRVLRNEIRLGDLFDEDRFYEKIDRLLPAKKETIAKLGGNPYDLFPDEEIKNLLKIGRELEDYSVDVSYEINNSLRAGKKVLAEGAQGTFLDVVHGTQKYVTSSSTIAGSACTGLGVGPSQVTKTIGLVKAYITRVGNGPLPTELDDEVGQHLVDVGHEFGTTTGRKRRCGWIDMPLLKKSINLNGYTELVLTKLDVLTGLETIKMCVAYELDGERIDYPPLMTEDMERCVPVYGDNSGWDEPIGHIRNYSELPEGARDFIEYIEKICRIPVSYVSVGPERDQTIKVDANRPKDPRCNPINRKLF
ncbi:adenylosuccinate synthase [Methanimicrococcus blatticola]|uniref:Adenylosuccinate synthetase n=1 Tax=Methanimicrococcus blatticola TaxID=91560 RepID=A0A484F352_9EURY|nr:adenylosuccinate synthase [Methanimicrococcus blatticola]MBZ3935991.1 adenylosuccinate synthase [Methanimicrococcus blatticola]MCC2509396.1 adenylosuccinate synthase [Methanimicrococcus blatticola]TDQ68279.1 adenylosuccinate synthetase [Methanimicrococcus blatticola]